MPVRLYPPIDPQRTTVTTLALVRHGQTDLNLQLRWQGTTDAPLNDLGRRQAAQVADLLAQSSWTRVITSPLQRARQTAAIVATGLALPDPLPDAGLVEQHGGIAEGMLETEIRRRWPLEESIPGSETRAQVAKRGARTLTALAQRYPGESLIVVAHGTFIRLTIGSLVGSTQPLLPNGHFVVAAFDADAPARWALTSAAEWPDTLTQGGRQPGSP
jgi:probable phosphoglycerate mutase